MHRSQAQLLVFALLGVFVNYSAGDYFLPSLLSSNWSMTDLNSSSLLSVFSAREADVMMSGSKFDQIRRQLVKGLTKAFLSRSLVLQVKTVASCCNSSLDRFRVQLLWPLHSQAPSLLVSFHMSAH